MRMGKLFFIQAFYCITGIIFFVRDLFAKVPMGQGMVRAFIWPYAQWPFIKAQALGMIEPVLKMLQ
jgi:hypothetical protein